MTRDEAKRLVLDWDRYAGHEDIIRAYAEGKDIQYKALGFSIWVDVEVPAFTSVDKYRVKPKPVRLQGWVCVEDIPCSSWRRGEFRQSDPILISPYWKRVDVEV